MHFKRLCIALLALLLLSGCAAGREPERGSSSGAESIPEDISAQVPPVQSEPDGEEGSGYPPPAPEELFGALSGSFTHSSGIGAWSAELHIAADGSFTGSYHDTDMGDNGDEYPDGTHYYCDFYGTFAQPVWVNGYTFSTQAEELEQEGTSGEVSYDGFRFICIDVGDLLGPGEVLIYCSNAPVAELPEKFLFWVESLDSEVYDRETLDRYGLYCVAEQRGYIG